MSILLSITSTLLIFILCLLSYMKGKIDQLKIDRALFLIIRDAILRLPLQRPLLVNAFDPDLTPHQPFNSPPSILN